MGSPLLQRAGPSCISRLAPNLQSSPGKASRPSINDSVSLARRSQPRATNGTREGEGPEKMIKCRNLGLPNFTRRTSRKAPPPSFVPAFQGSLPRALVRRATAPRRVARWRGRGGRTAQSRDDDHGRALAPALWHYRRWGIPSRPGYDWRRRTLNRSRLSDGSGSPFFCPASDGWDPVGSGRRT